MSLIGQVAHTDTHAVALIDRARRMGYRVHVRPLRRGFLVFVAMGRC